MSLYFLAVPHHGLGDLAPGCGLQAHVQDLHHVAQSAVFDVGGNFREYLGGVCGKIILVQYCESPFGGDTFELQLIFPPVKLC